MQATVSGGLDGRREARAPQARAWLPARQVRLHIAFGLRRPDQFADWHPAMASFRSAHACDSGARTHAGVP
ncbi:hypothetical protein BLAT2472_20440 [Burkholderia latens]